MRQSIHKVVRDLFLKDTLAVETFKKGLLNTNAYAKQIQKKVEAKLKKKIKVNTITVAINRLKNKLNHLSTPIPQNNTVKLDSIDIFAPVIVSIVENTPKTLITLLNLQTDVKLRNNLISINTAPDKIVIIYKTKIATQISQLPTKVIKEFKGIFVKVTLCSTKELNNITKYLQDNNIDTTVTYVIENTVYLALPHNQLSKILQILN